LFLLNQSLSFFSIKEETEAFVKKTNYSFLKAVEFGFNSQSGEVY